MLFSVVIPTYNRLPLLKEALESVWRQTLTNYEVIVVDDGSTDGTARFARSMGQSIKLLEQTNRGPGAARNLGIHHARGEYIAFLDSDDLWFPWTLDIYAQIIRQSGQPAFIAGKPRPFFVPEELQRVFKENLRVHLFADYYAAGNEWRWWGASSFVIRADALRAVGGFSEANINSEDADLALKLGAVAGFVQVAAPLTFGYRGGGNLTYDLRKSLAGVLHKVRCERAGIYPGGTARAWERWRILTRHVRPVALNCIRLGMKRDAWELYWATFLWHCALGRWKFLLGFPLKALARR